MKPVISILSAILIAVLQLSAGAYSYSGLNDYNFHARRYNAAVPRFDKQDIRNGEYPWLSPYAYCAGNPVMNTDHYGDSVAVLIAPDGAGHFGHMAILIQNENLKWRLWSKNGTNNSSKSYGTSDKTQKGEGSFDTPEDFLQSDKNPVDPETNEREYTEAYVIPATPEEDRKAEEGAKEELSKDYFIFGSNCAKTVQSALKNAGKDDGSIHYWEYDNFMGPLVRKTPNLIYPRIKLFNPGKVIKTKN